MGRIFNRQDSLINKHINNKEKIRIFIVAATSYILIILFTGMFMSPELYGVNYNDQLLPPSGEHIFGTDFLGKDMFWRSVKGLSNSILVGLVASAISSIIALVFGISAALVGGKFDRLINWLVDCFMGMPHLVFLILVSYMIGRGGTGVAIAVAVTHWPELTRIVRAEVLQVKTSQYIKIAYKLGTTKLNIAKHHIVPHVLPMYLIGLVLIFPHAIMHEAALTFLGFGFSAEVPAIGGILSEAMKYLATGKWWLSLYPGLMLLVVIMLFDTIGTKLKVLLNPSSANE